MTEIAIPTEQPSAELVQLHEDNIARLARWADQADSAVRIAQVVTNTAMVPKAYRGKPDEAAAAILAGAEVGFSPMASLRAFDDLMGTPAPKAITLRAIVQGRGHDIEIRESTATHCVVEGRRKGSDRWMSVKWTIERATQAGYVAKNARWKADPTAQLVARATAEMAKWLDSAAIMGLPPSVEEIADQGIQTQAPTRQVTAADIVGQAVEHVSTEPQLASSDQLADIHDLFETHQIARPARRQLVVEAIGRDVTGLADITAAEADQVAAAIVRLGQPA